MTAHATILPLLLPFVAAIVLLLRQGDIRFERTFGLMAAAAGIVASAWLVMLVDADGIRVYALGNWQAPFGIVLVADRLAATMCLLTACLAGAALLYASQGFDAEGRHFHALFQLQLFGLQGAFLTGDLFNLFVFFEVMLLASYALLGHGGGLLRTRAGLAYVVLNLIGSALFLIALGTLYAALGTLNLADMALLLRSNPENAALARLAAGLLMAVFLLKAALLPLSFWLPHAYAAAGAPVAALFAIMTKVGIVAALRLQVIALAPAEPTHNLLDIWLVPLALATLGFAALGVLASSRLAQKSAWLVLASAGTLLIMPALASERVTGAGLYYMVQSTFATAALFLLAGLLAERRGGAGDSSHPGPALNAPWLGVAFLIVAATLAGLPPFSGFLGKVMLLTAVTPLPSAAAIWTVVLVGGFLTLIALARAGSYLFWDRQVDVAPAPPSAAGLRRAVAVTALVAAGPVLALSAGPVSNYLTRTAQELHAPERYIGAVLPAPAPKEKRQ